MSHKLEVTFSEDNKTNVLYMILRLFFGKYDEENGGKTDYKMAKFETQKKIADAIRTASNGVCRPAQSAISKRLADIEETVLVYNSKEYRLRKVNGYYKMTDSSDLVASAKLELTEYRPYLSRASFRNNINQNQVSTLYAFEIASDNVTLHKLKDAFQRALGATYFKIIEHEKVVFLLLNANSDSLISDARWLNEYFSHCEK